MAIKFSVVLKDNYFICKYSGSITGSDALEAWNRFLTSNAWVPGLNEFTDFSEADLKKITADELIQLSTFLERFYKSQGIDEVRIAIYAPHDLPYGIGKMYSFFSKDSLESVQVFKEKKEALLWLLSD